MGVIPISHPLPFLHLPIIPSPSRNLASGQPLPFLQLHVILTSAQRPPHVIPSAAPPNVILTSAKRPPHVILNVAQRSEESIAPHAQPSSPPVILAHTSPHLLLPNSPHYAPISSMTCYHWSNFPKGYSQLHPQEPKRSLRQAFRNLLVSLPLPLKCRLFVTNNCTKIFRLSLCCGNNGQPGC